MGQVRVQVRLTNVVDQVNLANGTSTEMVRHYTADALVDTGAVCSVVPQYVVDTLGLTRMGRRLAEYADGRKDAGDVVGPLLLEIQGRVTIDEALVLGDEVLIGQTILEKMDLLVDCANQRLIGNPAHPDQPVLKVK
jgi:clan AA aspartic protease